MTAREIGFPCSAWEVRAILEGRKTQARRVMKPQPNGFPFFDGEWLVHGHGEAGDDGLYCPYGNPGDGCRLWVRETWGVGSRPDPWGGYDGIEYRADEEWLDDDEDLTCYKVKIPDDVDLCDYRNGWKSSTSMPRWASRITLEVVEVRAQRLQEISESDCCADGGFSPITRDYKQPRFAELWDSTNAGPKHIRRRRQRGKPVDRWEAQHADKPPGALASNPWVWAITFRRVQS